MNLVPIAEYVESVGLGTQGTDLFIGGFPADVKTGVMIRPRLIGAKFNHYLPGYLKFHFQLVVRSPDTATAMEIGAQLAKTLHFSDEKIGEWSVNYLRPVTAPVPFPIGAAELTEVNVDFECCIVDPLWQA